MYVSSLYVHCLSRRTRLRLAQLVNGFNLVHAPPGIANDSLMDFVRGVWGGWRGPQRDRHRVDPRSRLGGAITVHTVDGRRVLSRDDDGKTPGSLVIQHEDGSRADVPRGSGFPGAVSNPLLETVYFVDFQNLPALKELFRAVGVRLPSSHGVDHAQNLHGKNGGNEVPEQESLAASVAEWERREIAVTAELADLDRIWNELDARRRHHESTAPPLVHDPLRTLPSGCRSSTRSWRVGIGR